MSEGLKAVRQWVSASGGACDARLGHGVILGEAGSLFRAAVGRPRRAALVTATTDEELVELTRRELSSEGFEVAGITLSETGEMRCLSEATQLVDSLAQAGITADDLVVAVGDCDLLSLLSAVCGSWCAGTPLAGVATDLVCAIEAVPTPRGLDAAGHAQMLEVRPWCHYLLVDFDHIELALRDERVREALALMVVTAMADSEQSFSRLWDRSLDIVEGDVLALEEQVVDTLKTRGRLVSSTALAVRQSLHYASELPRAISQLFDAAGSTLLAEGMRFSARIAAGEGTLPVDDVFTQDELLDRLGLAQVEADLDADRLLAVFKEECFVRSRRLQMALPQRLGCVRLSNVTDTLLGEHLKAFCASRAIG